MSHRVFGIVGWKNSGKTTLTSRLIAELSGRGLRIAAVKHAHHAFDIDHEGTDSFRHRSAGAAEVAIVSSRRWALIHELQDEEEPGLEAMLERLSPCDLVLVEGYKRGPHPKIECRRSGAKDTAPLAAEDPAILAIAADHDTEGGGLPLFSLEDISGIADFILQQTGSEAPDADPSRPV
ncbi:molybdopterin-guanine dinucleotide biosynthesis protein B [Nitratireductor pacificus]|uniref:Molybdopterin-guanine dinucleotide biosynthesis protein B n=1 Tax=Nitratireductor pacificus pht-3B TaxID=391937 RepID=K2MKZ9_9HYPH|nr:molybdopterin-guanine dinucleotide biosynthesis protein B [Nitratireductor pacificus]EKF17912.1 molybdopterin-guanine dinucleotide biosynthesis protein B [Nitratireductor pacificus pht-3B]